MSQKTVGSHVFASAPKAPIRPIVPRHPSRVQNIWGIGSFLFDEHDRQATEKRLVRRLEKLGYHVELQTPTQIA